MDPLSALNEEVLWCTASFQGREAKDKRVLLGWGNPHARYLFIGEAPSLRNQGPGTVFLTGPNGKTFLQLLAFLSISLKEVYVTNAIKCTLPGETVGKWEACAPFLKKEIEIVDPEFVICLGLVAQKACNLTHPGLSVRNEGSHKVKKIRRTPDGVKIVGEVPAWCARYYFGAMHPGIVRHGMSLEYFLNQFLPIKNPMWRDFHWAKA